MKDKISLDDAIFRLLETCYSIRVDRAKKRIDDLLCNLNSIVYDFVILEPREIEEDTLWELKVVWKTGMNYVATKLWVKKVEGGMQEHIEWTTPG